MRKPVVILLLALALGLAGCASPRVAPPGGQTVQPLLADDVLRTADGLVLPAKTWRPNGASEGAPENAPRAVVLALHGFNDYSGAFREIGPQFAEAGVAVYAYDQRGFGGAPNRGVWPGRAALRQDAEAAARLLRRRYPGTPLYLLGLSMGGAVAMTALAEAPGLAAGAILVGPAVQGRRHIPKWQLWALDAAVATIPWYPATGQGLGLRPTDNIEALRRMSRDPMVLKQTRLDALYGLVDLTTAAAGLAARQTTPLLLLYGLKDDLVAKAPTLAALDAMPRPPPGRPPHRLAVYQDGHHMLLRDLNHARVVQDILAWIAAPTAPLPSGADVDAHARLAAAAAR